jgi:hypothetical protein
MDGAIALPVSVIITLIVTLGGVIGFLFRELIKSQNTRQEETKEYTTKVLTALNENTNALKTLTEKIVEGAS